ncbi:MAG: hypothetical protein MUD02_00420, partial [Bacteroidales bacterium]|nr:hypothetical protein [Bacteroidales bacterium]
MRRITYPIEGMLLISAPIRSRSFGKNVKECNHPQNTEHSQYPEDSEKVGVGHGHQENCNNKEIENIPGIGEKVPGPLSPCNYLQDYFKCKGPHYYPVEKVEKV